MTEYDKIHTYQGGDKMTDKLSEIFFEQSELNSRIRRERKLDYSFDEWMRQWALAVLSETNEILDEINWKHWKNAKPVNIESVKEEVADLLHFVVSMALTCDMNADELHYRYMVKNKENHDRQEGKVSGREDYEVTNNNERRSV